ncbi:MAG: helix-turn-helix transcriptional regulator [Saprospiraceae bacterium]|nr:helix-turn-helix transcriptional regulator [Saprospiraceae bacterium]
MEPTLSQDMSKIDVSITPRETEVLKLISFGYSTSDIARYLYISMETVRSHRKHLLQKIGANNTALLVRRSLEFGLL